MRTRTRFALDIMLMAGLALAYQPTWTGITIHQWLSIAIIAPLLLHLIVNWEWASRMLRTFVAKLLSTSRLNFAVDCSLMVATVMVMVSGFMVSPELLAPFGIHPANPLEWHDLHSWSANATIAIFTLHALLHWRWFVAAARRLTQPQVPQPSRFPAAAHVAASAIASAEATNPLRSAQRPRRSRVGSRAAQAAAERATFLRVASVFSVTAALGVAVFAGAGAASPLFAHASQTRVASQRAANASLQACPQTGCTASTCHGTTHADPTTFYAHRSGGAKAVKRVRPARAATSHTVATRVARAARPSTGSRTTPTAPRAKAATKPAATRKTLVCPQTGCSASSCHGAHHQSASSYYK